MLDKKKLIIIFISVIFISTILIFVFKIKNNIDSKNSIIEEYTPEEEITESQYRQTSVNLFFKNNNELECETRLIDVKKLLNDPYEIILNMLIDGPKNENLNSTIPLNTKINNIEKINDILIIDFSDEFIKNHIGGETEEKLTIISILKTLTSLSEINGIKIKINGEENKSFIDGFIKFDKIFYNSSF